MNPTHLVAFVGRAQNGKDHTNCCDGVREDNPDRAEDISENNPAVNCGGRLSSGPSRSQEGLQKHRQ